MDLHMESRYVGPVCVVKCKGRLVLGPSTEALDKHVTDAIAQSKVIVLNMADVMFMDSSGLGTLVRLLRRAKSSHIELRLCCLTTAIRKALDVTHVASLFKIDATEEAALGAGYSGKAEGGQGNPAAHILCVAETSDVCACLGALLQGAGFHAQTCSSLYDAKTLLKAKKPDLILLGAQMPQKHPGVQQNLGALAPGVPVLTLDETFSTQEAGVGADPLLARIRQHLPASA